MNKIPNIVKSSCISTNEGISLNASQSFTLSYNVEVEGYYDLELKYTHDSWDQWVKVTVHHPDGETLNYMPPMPFGDFAEVTLYFKKGENLVEISANREQEIIFKEITLMGFSVKTLPELSPKSDCFYKDAKRPAVILLSNFRRRLEKITADGKEIPFTTQSFGEVFNSHNFYSGIYHQKEYVYIQPEVIDALPLGDNALTLHLEGGFTLDYTLKHFETKPKSKLEIISFELNHSSATLLKLPNGKNLLIDCGDKRQTQAVLIPYLTKNDIYIDYFLLTHYHSDHHGLGEELWGTYGIKAPEFVDIKAHKSDRYKLLSKYRYLDSNCLRTYDKLHEIWDLGGVEITALNSRYDMDGNRLEVFNYPQIKYNEHNYENTTSVATLIKYNGFSVYHGADTYAHCQQRILEDYKKLGAEDELKCQYFYANHHFHVDLAPEFMQAVNPEIVYIPSNESLYSRSTCIYEFGRDVKEADYEDKRLLDAFLCYESGTLFINVNSGDDWTYSLCRNCDL